MQQTKIAIMGLGTVGFGIYRILTENQKDIQHRERAEITVKRILVRDKTRGNAAGVEDRTLLTTELNDLLNDPEISVIAECIGGEEPARSYLLAAMRAGKTVVTANKELLSKHWQELESVAKEHNVGLYYEATVCGGIPIIRTISDSLQANNIEEVMGIINGTTNYILSSMSEQGRAFEDVLKEAQQLGYAEANPAADVEGWDAVYKLSILSSMAFHAHLPVNCIYREGITAVTPEDIQMAHKLGYEIKLLAIGKKCGTHMEVRVHPTMIPKDHPLSSVRGSFNAVFLRGSAVGDLMLYGRGAGQLPTASAMVSDIAYASRGGKPRYMTFENISGISEQVRLEKDWQCVFYLRLLVDDQPRVLSSVSGVLADHGVSIKSLIQHDETKTASGEAVITILTHKAHELAVQKAMEEIEKLDVVKKKLSLIRVED